jgi:hypothetical protein
MACSFQSFVFLLVLDILTPLLQHIHLQDPKPETIICQSEDLFWKRKVVGKPEQQNGHRSLLKLNGQTVEQGNLQSISLGLTFFPVKVELEFGATKSLSGC